MAGQDDAMSDSPIPADARLEFRRIDQLYLTVRTAIRGLCWIAAAWVGFGALGKFAGQSTGVDLALSFAITALVEIKLSWLSF
jgi:hypothetical protein